MGGCQLHVIAFAGVGDAAAGKKRPPEKGDLAALLLHDGIVHVQGQGIPGGKSEGLHDARQLLLLPDLEHQLAGGGETGVAVKV